MAVMIALVMSTVGCANSTAQRSAGTQVKVPTASSTETTVAPVPPIQLASLEGTWRAVSIFDPAVADLPAAGLLLVFSKHGGRMAMFAEDGCRGVSAYDVKIGANNTFVRDSAHIVLVEASTPAILCQGPAGVLRRALTECLLLTELSAKLKNDELTLTGGCKAVYRRST